MGRREVAQHIRNNWGPLSGIVHGGRELLSAYITEEGIGAEVELYEMIDIVTNTVSLAHMVIAVMMAITPLSTEGQQAIIAPVHESFGAFVRQQLS